MTTAECYKETAREQMDEIREIIKGIKDTESQHMIIGGIEFDIHDDVISFQSFTASGLFRIEDGITPINFTSRQGHVSYNSTRETVTFYSEGGDILSWDSTNSP